MTTLPSQPVNIMTALLLPLLPHTIPNNTIYLPTASKKRRKSQSTGGRRRCGQTGQERRLVGRFSRSHPQAYFGDCIMTPSETRMSSKDRTPTVLLPYQQAWCADQSPVKLCEKSRRIGLSWGEAADTALLAASAKGMDAWYIGYNKDMALEFIRDCAGWAKHYQLAAGEIEETEEVFVEGDDRQAVLAFVIRFASGFRITALSSRPSNLRGKQGRVIIDEAAFHEQLGELLKAAMALLMWGGQVHIISTHDGVDNPFNELINDVRAGKKPYSDRNDFINRRKLRKRKFRRQQMEKKPTRSSRRPDSATDRPTCSQHLHTSRQRLRTHRK